MYFTLILKLFNIKLFVARTKAIIPAKERFPTMIEDRRWMIKTTLRASHQIGLLPQGLFLTSEANYK